ncbi:MAG: hypothetical protein KTR31_41925 [Myxococcales bacterium]|nr:hypothetical protein [Myxococcales bacterium]
MLCFALAGLAHAADPAFNLRISQSVGWTQGAYVGSEGSAALQGLPLRTSIAFGFGSGVAGGMYMAGQVHPWIRIRAADATYEVLPNATFAFDGWMEFPLGAERWRLTTRLGIRLPFIVRGAVHRADLEDFFGPAAAVGIRHDFGRSRKGWALGLQLEIEGQRLASSGNEIPVSFEPRIDLLIPSVSVTVSYEEVQR